jgi:hypothetical protein
MQKKRSANGGIPWSTKARVFYDLAVLHAQQGMRSLADYQSAIQQFAKLRYCLSSSGATLGLLPEMPLRWSLRDCITRNFNTQDEGVARR